MAAQEGTVTGLTSGLGVGDGAGVGEGDALAEELGEELATEGEGLLLVAVPEPEQPATARIAMTAASRIPTGN